ncbi:MAG: hypothetical protein V7607_216 [Solirubrobacteraceae bacterium]
MSWVPRPIAVQQPASSAVDPCPWITDEFLESYVAWREASEDVRAADEHWRTCEPRRRRVAFECYRAALDFEEQAARIYFDRTARLLTLGRASA